MTHSTAKMNQDTWGAEVALDEIKPSPRVQALREYHLNLKGRVGVEVARYWTQAYQESEGEPRVQRRAKAIVKYLENVSLYIHPGELIVGVKDKQPMSTVQYPDITCGWIDPELDLFETRDFDPLVCDDETKRIYRDEIIPYWEGKTFAEIWQQRAKQVAPEAFKIGFETCISEQQSITFFTLNHFVPGFRRVMEKGFVGIREEVEAKIRLLQSTDKDYFEKATYYQSLLRVCDAAAGFGKRYAALARELAEKERDPQLKDDYLKLADICERVPAQPARSFHEAVQSLYFSLLMMLNDASSVSFGRLDQYLYPYLKRDLDAGTITRDEAQELLDCLFIKCSEIQILFSAAAARYATGAKGANMLCVGGVDEHGFDASNELSYMLLQAMCNVRLGQPSVSVLWHPNMPEDLAIKALKLSCLGTGHPSIFNTTRLVEMLQETGLPLREARKGSTVGCVESSGEAGTTNSCSNFGYLNLAVMMEFALNRGVWRMTGERMGSPTDDPRTFTSFDQLVEAYRQQVEYLVRQHVTLGQITESMHAELDPDPYADLFFADCIENGRGLYAGGAKYNFGPGILFTGIADVINSMAAIKHLVFDEKKLTWDEMLTALENNFEGQQGEKIRQMCLNAPKYGNDDPYVDAIADMLMGFPPAETAKYTSQWGAPWRAAIIPLTTIFPFGLVTGALPGGKRAGESLAEGCSPKQGTDLLGPTAAIKSVTAFDHSAYLDGTQFNLKFSPAVLKDRWGLMNLMALIKTFIARGGYHVQMNVVSKETLLEAQKHPEDYKGLTVRVSGYNSYFTVLSKEIQDDIIARTEHAMMA